ncbi:glycosyltransferase family 4 protein [Gramella jeungdoensis]|uniref:Glycosyltransferase family 4 protein n=1 Tax=Gramella jeungdoensis TaxID=708091 RepID=A0ABT0YZ68_9FLAO|nr:glycosyltransferase family 4 protein [Gramella jeungdoensis]MCM8568759.1 glycosyltransferase family 4 protein [Gramella jeungdoensis]
MKKKILFILHYPPPVHGAAMVGDYIRKSDLINEGFNTRYINLGTSRDINEIGDVGILKWLRYFKILFKTFYQTIFFRPDLTYFTLNSNGVGFYKDALVAIVAKLGEGKLVYHFHNKGIQKREAKSFDNFLYRKVFKDAEIILLSENLYPDIQKYVDRRKVHICPNGIPQYGKKVSLNGIDKEIKKVQLLFLSNLIESKGVFVLLEALKKLKDRGIHFHCSYIGGEGDVSAEFFNSKINDFGLKNFVFYEGKKYGNEKLEYLLKSHVFVLPTLNDCFPLVILEALQFSLPVVSTIEGGISEMVENEKNGFLVQKNDAFEIADKLEILIKDRELREKMGAYGNLKYTEEFTLEAFEYRLNEILENLVSWNY